MGCVVDVELGIDDICQACVMEEVRSTYKTVEIDFAADLTRNPTPARSR